MEESLQGMELQEKKSTKRLKHAGKLFKKETPVKIFLLILDLKPLRS